MPDREPDMKQGATITQMEERGQATERGDERRLKLDERLQEFYRKPLEALNTEAAAIAARQSKGRGWRGLAYRVTGRAERDRQQEGAIKAGLADIAQRQAEQRGALNARQQAAAARLAARHADRASQLERQIEQRRGEREAAGWIPRQQDVRREATTGQEIRIDAEAEFSPVEGREFSTDETASENEQAQTAPPEAAQEQNSGQGQEAPQSGWSSEAEREAAIRQARELREADEREQGRDPDDPGREM